MHKIESKAIVPVRVCHRRAFTIVSRMLIPYAHSFSIERNELVASAMPHGEQK